MGMMIWEELGRRHLRMGGRVIRGAVCLLLAAGLLTGCRSTPKSELQLAEVTVPRMSSSALQELIGLRMRAHDWRLARQEPALLVFERRAPGIFQSLMDSDAISPVTLRAEITLNSASDGIRLRAAVRRIDASKSPPRETVESPKELREILEEIRNGIGGGPSWSR